MNKHIPNLYNTLLILSILVYYLIKNNPEIFSSIPEKIAFVSGFYNNKYQSVDHFPIFPWIIVVLIGVIVGHYIKKKKDIISKNIKENNGVQISSTNRNLIREMVNDYDTTYQLSDFINFG